MTNNCSTEIIESNISRKGEWKLEIAIATIFRSLLTIVVLFIFTRLIGRRQITQLTYFEYITGITLGSIAAYTALERDKYWWVSLIALGVWTVVSIAMEYITLYSKKARDVLEGKGVVLIKDGKVMEDNLKKVKYTADDLLEQIRQRNAFKVADVEFAVLETSGELSVLLKRENAPLTLKHLGMQAPNMPEPQTVVIDGKILLEPLATLGLNQAWLHTELEKLGIDLSNVFLGQVDGFGQLYVDVYDDKLKVPSPQNLRKIMATIKKCEADLELFALATKDTTAKKMYEQCAQEMTAVQEQMQPLLRV